MKVRLAGVALGVAAICGLALAPAAFADYTVHSPNVEQGENEIEWNSFASWGTNPESGAIQASKFEFGRGMNDFWASEIEFNSEKEDGNSLRPTELEWENRFQLTPQGKYWLDTGLYTEIEYQRGGTYEITVGPTFGKDFGRVSTLLNVFASHEYGNDADSGVGLEYRARIEYRWKLAFSPLIEAYGKPVGRIGAFGPPGAPRNLIGPGITGKASLGGGKGLHWAVVALFGTSNAAADRTLVARMEYEFF
ncbi:MAG: hypothetical protein ACRES7_11530 [Gammaproteobacteria bacterium]